MLGRLFDRILLALACVAAAIVIYTGLSVDYEVIMRYFFNEPTLWVVAFAENAMIFILFLCTAWVLSHEDHVKVDLLVSALSTKKQHLLNTITSVIGTLSCAIFFLLSVWLTWEAYVGGDLLWKAIITPKWPILAVMPFGSLMLTIQFGRRAWRYWGLHKASPAMAAN